MRQCKTHHGKNSQPTCTGSPADTRQQHGDVNELRQHGIRRAGNERALHMHARVLSLTWHHGPCISDSSCQKGETHMLCSTALPHMSPVAPAMLGPRCSQLPDCCSSNMLTPKVPHAYPKENPPWRALAATLLDWPCMQHCSVAGGSLHHFKRAGMHVTCSCSWQPSAGENVMLRTWQLEISEQMFTWQHQRMTSMQLVNLSCQQQNSHPREGSVRLVRPMHTPCVTTTELPCSMSFGF